MPKKSVPLWSLEIIVWWVVIGVGVDGATTAVYPIDWDRTPSASTSVNHNASLGRCICDLTLNRCDVNCCCDPECLPSVVSTVFTECVPSQFSEAETFECVGLNDATKIVREWNGRVARQATIPAASAVCVVRQNYPADNPATFEVTLGGGVPGVENAVDWFDPATRGGGGYSALSIVSHYIPVATGNGAAAVRLEGAVGVWAPRALAACGLRRTPFLQRASSWCYESRTTAQELCAALSISQFGPYAIGTTVDVPSSLAGVAPVMTFVIDASTGSILEQQSSRSVFERAFEGAYLAQDFTTRSEFSGGVCLRAVTRIRTRIEYAATTGTSAGGIITNVTRELYVVNLASGATSAVVATQVDYDTAQTKSLPSREVPGRPGYVVGRGVVAGSLQTNGTRMAVAQRQSGLVLPFGSCTAPTLVPIAFDFNYSSSCTTTWTRQELSNLCTRGTTDVINAILQVPTGTENVANITHLGIIADANPYAVADWVAIGGLPLTSNAAAGVYNDVSGICTTLPVGMEIVIVISRAGAEANPQDVIVAAEARPIMGSWSAGSGESSTQTLLFRVTFVRSFSAASALRVVSPPLIGSIDDEIFYPFRLP